MGVVAVTPSTFPSSQWCSCCCGGCEVRAPRLSLSKGHCFLSAERITVLWSSSLNMPRSTMRQTQVRLPLIRWISHYLEEPLILAHILCSGCSHLQDYSELDDWEALHTSIKLTSLTFLLEIKNKLTKNLHRFLVSHFCQCVYCVLVVFPPFYKTSACAESPPPCSHGPKRSQCFSRRSHSVILTSWPQSHNSAVLFPLLMDCNSKFFCFL